MSQSAEIVPYPDKMKSSEPLSFQDIRLNTSLVKKALKEVMIKTVDFGTVPGCGDKLGLFKPGAEKLMLLFKLGCFPEVQRLHDDPDALEFIVRTRIIHIPTGAELGVGLGSSSSNEEKYKWREATKKEWDNTPEERKRIKYKRGDYDKAKRTYGPEKEILQVRTNPADLNNTLLKMACKRSKVDAVITCTGASDIFTQDMEDDGLPTIQSDEQPLKRPESKESEKTSENAPNSKSEAGKKPIPAGYRPIKAKWNGLCSDCGLEVKEGSDVLYNDQKKKVCHPECV